MSFIRTLWKCNFGPRLFKVYEITWIGRLVEVCIKSVSNLLDQCILGYVYINYFRNHMSLIV